MQVLANLPPTNYQILQRIIRLLVKVAEKHSINKMTEDNLAIVMGPTLLRSKTDPVDYMGEMRISCEVVLAMLQNYPMFFPDAEANPSAIRVSPYSPHRSRTLTLTLTLLRSGSQSL